MVRTPLIALAVVSFVAAEAQAGLSLVGMGTQGGYSAENYTAEATSTFKGKLSYGGGLLLSLPLSRSWGVELGALHYLRQVEETSAALSPSTQALTSRIVQVPLVLRTRLMRYFSIGVGGYASQAIGELSISAPGHLASTRTYDEWGLKKRDYGALGSARISIPFGMITSFIIDARYLYGMVNLSDPAVNGANSVLKTRDLQFLAGLSFGY